MGDPRREAAAKALFALADVIEQPDEFLSAVIASALLHNIRLRHRVSSEMLAAVTVFYGVGLSGDQFKIGGADLNMDECIGNLKPPTGA